MSLLGARLKELRSNISLREAGKALGFDASTLSRYERGADIPEAERMRKMAVYFQVSYAELRKLYYRDLFEQLEDDLSFIHEVASEMMSEKS